MELEGLEMVEFIPEVGVRSSRGRGAAHSVDQTHSNSDGGECEQDQFLPHPMGTTEGTPRAWSEQGRGQVSLQKEITLLSGVGVITGMMIGSGIYVTPQNILTHAGSFGVCVILWVAVAVVAVCGGLCYVELGLLVRKSGGEFTYLVEAYSFKHRNRGVTILGALMGFLCVWVSFCISGTSSLAISVLLCSQYIIQPFFVGCCVSELAVKCFAIAVLSKLGCKCVHMQNSGGRGARGEAPPCSKYFD